MRLILSIRGLDSGLILARMFVFTSCLTLFITSSFTVAETVSLARDSSDMPKLPYKLLASALERENAYERRYPYGNIKALPYSTRLQAARNGEIDVFWAMTSRELEDEFIPVYIPIYKGMMGYRLAIVKQERRDQFAQVGSLQDLKRFTAGQGTYWADSKILEANGLPLVKEMKYDNMFRMLEAERFDYFPRGAHEPWSELEQRSELGLVVDEHVVLSYKAPFYFFVSKNKPNLAEHLYEQLNAMIEEGAYRALFHDDPEIKKAISLGGFDKRTVIELDNPSLSQKTPINRAELWYTPLNQK